MNPIDPEENKEGDENNNKKNIVSKANLINLLLLDDNSFNEYINTRDPNEKVDTSISQDISSSMEDNKHNLLNNKNNINTSTSYSEDNIQNNENNQLAIQHRTLLNRMFGKMENGSLRSSIFSMCSLAIGASALSTPNMFDKMSLVLGIIMLALAALASYWTLTIMIKSSLKVKVYNYSELCEKALGRWASLTYDLTILVYVFGVILSYEVTSKYYFNKKYISFWVLLCMIFTLLEMIIKIWMILFYNTGI